MAVETKDILGWFITGGLGAAGLLLNILSRRDAARKSKRDAEAVWSLHLHSGATQGATGQMFRLSLADLASNRYRLSSVKVIEPKGAKISHLNNGRHDVNAGEIPDSYTDSLVFDRDLEPGLRINPQTMSVSRSSISGVVFFADWPSATERKKWSRLVVVISVNEISSSRRESRLTIRSQPIDWTVRAAPNAK